ncbi:uncharacterized protein LOC100844324 [Brachypodium distachyon]|nr:uncharacterized protein LOC100844324 [Brachypodium distachyon]|eukprot:XP_010237030.1 uncharacterized protein LOC100844324 [Brachypodium distachyon]
MFFLGNSSYVNGSCASVEKYFTSNLTSSYADQTNEATMVLTSVVMFMLAALFFSLNLFSRLSDLSAILNPSVRLFLSTSLSLFLPVMSYLFSEAKNEAAALVVGNTDSSSYYSQLGTELSLRARTILMWMLLVELLRKKVEAILVNVAVKSYTSTIDRASRIAWLGYLVFYNLRSTGKKAVYGILWVLGAAKFLQRLAINELLRHSLAYGKNAELLSSYMAQIMLQEQDNQHQDGVIDQGADGVELLRGCKYALMGEEDLEVKAGPDGYQIELKNNTIVTVGDVWTLADKEDRLQQDSMLKRLCLSFALYKLMRRRFEDLPPITDKETSNCRSLIFKGLRKQLHEEAEAALLPSSTTGGPQEHELLHLDAERKEDLKGTVVAVALFQVFDEEIQFLCEYYHSVLPVVLSNPFFFFANYILFPILVLAFCLLTFILCGNGDVRYAYKSIREDNYIVSIGTIKLAMCLLGKITSPAALFSIVDLSITMLLLLTFLYEELWEYLVFILSNWLMVSLLCKYTAAKKPCHEPRDSRSIPFLSGLIRGILWVRSKMSRRQLSFKQFSMLGFTGGRSYASMMMMPNTTSIAVPMEVKKSIMEYLMDAHVASAARPLSSGWSTLQSEKHNHRLNSSSSRLSSACKSKSVAEVILTWHVATSILEFKCPMPTGGRARRHGHGHRHRKVAATLSGYCTYLVALYPELLPDNKDGTNHVYKKMQQELKKELGGCLRYRMSSPGARYDKLLSLSETADKDINSAAAEMVHEAAKLGKTLVGMAEQEEDHVWELLADLWTELMVYVAPSGSELHVKAHKEALAHGGEFITVLWALCTHTGITRTAVEPCKAVRGTLEV